MDEQLISKKELLQRFGISYGALYRWKRMGLIPEDWFLRRSTFTGQETFFRREQILPRIEQILSREASLGELAGELTKRPAGRGGVPVLTVQDAEGLYRYPLSGLVSLTVEHDGGTLDLLTYLKGELS